MIPHGADLFASSWSSFTIEMCSTAWSSMACKVIASVFGVVVIVSASFESGTPILVANMSPPSPLTVICPLPTTAANGDPDGFNPSFVTSTLTPFCK